MLESSAFRMFMAIGGVIILASIVAGFFYFPAVPVDQPVKDAYHSVMGGTVGIDTHHENHLTMYETIVFNVEGRSRSRVQFY